MDEEQPQPPKPETDKPKECSPSCKGECGKQECKDAWADDQTLDWD